MKARANWWTKAVYRCVLEFIRLTQLLSHWDTDSEETMLRHLQVPRLAQKTITIRVDYLVRVISLLFLIGILTSCVPEEDAVESS